MNRWVINPDGYKGTIRTHLDKNGCCPYTGKTAAEYIAEGCTIVSDDELFDLIHAYSDSLCGHWEEISEDKYYEMLDVLPPVAYQNGGWFMSERYWGSVSGFYQRVGDKFYTSLQNMRTPRYEILLSLEKWIKERENQHVTMSERSEAAVS